MLPGSPKIFHGREEELDYLVSALLRDEPARVAILGTGGIGKSSLALAALHHPDVMEEFGTRRFFITCDGTNSATSMISAIAAHFNLDQHDKPAQAVLRHFINLPGPAVLVLDNFETPWEPPETREHVEDFLSLLSEFETLNLVVCFHAKLSFIAY